MEVHRYDPTNQSAAFGMEDWNRFVGDSWNGTFLFDRGYMDYHADRFHDHSLILYEKGQLVSIVPANSDEDSWRTHGGLTYGGLIMQKPLSQRAVVRAFDALKEYLSDAGFKHAYYKAIPQIYLARPNQTLEFGLTHSGFTLCRRDASTTVFLEHREKIPKGRKASLSKARKGDLRIEESDDLPAFFALQDANVREKYAATSVHTAEEMSLLKSRFPGQIKLYLVRPGVNAGTDESPIAGAVVYVTERVLHLQYFAMNSVGEELGATDLLIDYLIAGCAERGTKIFDFGISTEKDGLYLNEGLNKYKESFGGVTTLYESYELSL